MDPWWFIFVWGSVGIKLDKFYYFNNIYNILFIIVYNIINENYYDKLTFKNQIGQIYIGKKEIGQILLKLN